MQETIGNTSMRLGNRLETRMPEGANSAHGMRGERPVKYPILAVVAVGVVLGAASIASDAEQQKGGGSQDRAQDQSHVQQQDMDRLHDKERVREQEQLKLRDEDIYGFKLMSPDELKQYRERHRLMKTEEERARFEMEHREQMQQRARALNVEIEDAE
jgi:hypothetical protein